MKKKTSSNKKVTKEKTSSKKMRKISENELAQMAAGALIVNQILDKISRS
jgi:hypothetical protein